MPNYEPNVFARDDTFFGVCEALGEDFGFNPAYLRIALGVLLLWNPLAVLGGYAAAGLVVAVSRRLVPNPAFAPALADAPAGGEASAGEPAAGSAAAAGDNDADALAAAA